ncbi:F-box/FBD/LRR-repeat protein, partial [Trifolium pratense]
VRINKQQKSTLIDAEPDRISCLPGHVIDQILSSLPIREAGRTSVLSSQWRNKWHTMPNLVFDKHCVSIAASQDPSIFNIEFLRIVDHVLLLHSGPITKFEISNYKHSHINFSPDINRWILYLIGRSIKELVLDVLLDEHYKIPWCLFSCQSLQRLQLNSCLLKPPTTFEGWRNLKYLRLDYVTITQDALEKLISDCPLLQSLVLLDIDVTEINIHAPNLKHFDINGKFEDISFDKTFQLVTYLAAGYVPIKLPTPCIYLDDLFLCINFNDLKEISAALCLLRSSPNLRKLEISARIEEQTVLLTSTSYCWEDIFSRKAMPIKVRHMMIDGISGTKSELDFIKFLLLYSPVLEKMIVKTSGNVTPELTKALIQFKRGSVEAEVIWDDSA